MVAPEQVHFIMQRILTWTLLLAFLANLLIGLSGCGKKGPLYLEKQEQQKS